MYHTAASRSLLLALVLQILLGSAVVVECGIISSFFKGRVGEATRQLANEISESAAEGAFSGLASKDPPPAAAAAAGRGTGGGLSPKELDRLESVVVKIRNDTTPANKNFCTATKPERMSLDQLLFCSFYFCCASDTARDARSVGQSCFLELTVKTIVVKRGEIDFGRQFCDDRGSADCAFYKCVVSDPRSDNLTDSKSVGNDCYRSSYGGASRTASPTSATTSRGASTGSAATSGTSNTAPALAQPSYLMAAVLAAVSLFYIHGAAGPAL